MDLTQQQVLANWQPGQPPLVLAVDDDRDNLVLMSYVLEGFACLPICMTDGQEALAFAQRVKPDLILLDILLPSLNGFELLRLLRSNPATHDIPVIAVTALAKPGDREKLLAAGCSDYISKPYLLTDLKNRIDCYLHHYLAKACPA